MELKDFFMQNPRCAVAFSGGVDSAYLLAIGVKYAKEIKAYFVKSAFQPQFELDDAVAFAKEHNCNLEIINIDVLSHEIVVQNPYNRCYYCKKVIFNTILDHAKKDGFSVLLDGTNASDDASDRPGMKVLEELKVLSPLRECGLTKQDIRKNSKELGLFTHDKPSYACLATRVSTGTRITADILQKIENSEEVMKSLGYSDFRLRYFDSYALLQLTEGQIIKAINERETIQQKLLPYYKNVVLDLKTR